MLNCYRCWSLCVCLQCLSVYRTCASVFCTENERVYERILQVFAAYLFLMVNLILLLLKTCSFANVVLVSGGLPSVLWHCWLGDRKGIWPVKTLGVGLLVVTIWLELCTSYSSSCYRSPLSSLAPVKSRMETFWCQLIHVVVESGHWMSVVWVSEGFLIVIIFDLHLGGTSY